MRPSDPPPHPNLSPAVTPLCRALVLAVVGLFAATAAEPGLEQRVSDLEAYIRNTAPAGPIQGNPGPGHNGWMMVSAGLVLFMTLPGLALFYGGLVRRKNVLSVLAQCLGLAGIVTILWWVCGYSLSFGKGSPFLGGFQWSFLRGVTADPNPDYGAWVSHNVYAMYQLMFAIITPGLIIGAVAERMRYQALMIFCAAWMVLVYFPVAHMLWGADGWMNGLWNSKAAIKSIDFAGGIVVHMTSGWSALILCLLLGPRKGFGREPIVPHSMVLCMVGTGMLWFGWYGFNAGSAVAADRIAANAFTATTLSAAVGLCVWAVLEWTLRRRPSVLGMCSGAVAGLATITPASGFVTPTGAVLIGLAAGLATFLACGKLKSFFRYDDSLDTFGVHAVGGTLGTLLAGVLATTEINANLSADWIRPLVGTSLWWEQVKAGGLVLLLSVVVTVILYAVIDRVVGCRVAEEIENQGLDLAEHGEEGYTH
ncbi:MAG: ammonium transporter [Verrucomicrobiales bacterium]|nr:ammonium transporter [Verrucomicrobiales bacterium]